MKINLKNKTIIVIAIILIMTILVTITTNVKAAEATGGEYSVSASLISNSKLKEGETVTINFNTTSVNAGNGISVIAAYIKYDENVFETIASSNFVMTNEWKPSYGAKSKKFTLIKDTKVTAPEQVLTIKLKVKDTINVESTTVTVENIVASGGRVSDGGTGDIAVGNASVTISKEKEATGNTTKPDNTIPENTTKPENTIKPENKTQTPSSTTTTRRDNTATKKSTLPKAGMEEYAPIAILVIAIIAIFSYVLYKKLAKDIK